MKNTLLRPTWATKLLAGTVVLGMAVTANAQGQGQGQGQGGGNRQNMQNMTPEQRQQMMARMEERRAEQRQEFLTQTITAAGITDPASQTAILDAMTAQEKTRATLQEQARTLAQTVANPASTDTDIRAQLLAYRAAVAAATIVQTNNLAALDAKVNYTTKPRVETLLTLLGLVGNETSEIGGLGEVFPESPYGTMGRGMGGGRGGQGGAGGQGGGGGRGGRRGGDQNGGAQADN